MAVPQSRRSIIKGDPINPPVAVEVKFRRELFALLDELHDESVKTVQGWLRSDSVEEFFAQDASPEVQARKMMKRLMEMFTERFMKKTQKIVDTFVSKSSSANEAAVKASIKKMAGAVSLPRSMYSPFVRELLSATVSENVDLIKTIGEEYLGKVNQLVLRHTAMGLDITGLQKKLERFNGISKKRAKIIAYDQTQKISNTLSRARFQNAGLTKYIWRHTGGAKEPRPLHVKYDGQVFKYDRPVLVQKAEGKKPAVYGYPGTLINCSCRQQPVIEFED